MNNECKKSESFFQTYSGVRIFPSIMCPEDVNIKDIAHSLSMQCRYNGHCQRFYSVAQHSLLIASKASVEAAPYALIHDAAEAYLSDMPNPFKRGMPEYCGMEDGIMQHVLNAFGIPISDEIKAEVHYLDKCILLDEFEQLLDPIPQLGIHDNINGTVKKLDVKIAQELPLQFKETYMVKFYDYMKGYADAYTTNQTKVWS